VARAGEHGVVVRERDGRWYVEIYDPDTRKKRQLNQREIRALGFEPPSSERQAKRIERAALSQRDARRPGSRDESCGSFAARWPDDYRRATAAGCAACPPLSTTESASRASGARSPTARCAISRDRRLARGPTRTRARSTRCGRCSPMLSRITSWTRFPSHASAWTRAEVGRTSRFSPSPSIRRP
jgi:hypothetical protein